MRRADFEALVRRLAGEVPAEYLDGVAEIAVAPPAVPHPTRAEIYTLGECIPLPAVDADPGAVQSRVVLYHGSFQALARLDPEFDWREEAWETLTHELRHHLEWRARAPDLEALDRAAEANFARQDGEPFDPLFFLDGEHVAEGVWRIDHDYFLDRIVRRLPERVAFAWHGRPYLVDCAGLAGLPAFLTVDEVEEPPPGELVLVLRRRPRLRDLFSRSASVQAGVVAEPVPPPPAGP